MSKVELRAYCNIDDVFLVWRAEEIDGCIGFAIERVWLETKVPDRATGKPEYLLNRVGFKADAAGGPNQRQPSNVWPFQRYNWTDHEVSFGDKARYRVVPMVGKPGQLKPAEDLASAWLDVDASEEPDQGQVSCFFNRPMAASPWMARTALKEGIKTSTDLVKLIGKESSKELREFCGGTLIYALRNLLDYAQQNADVHLYGALFELKDDEITDRFCQLGGRAHFVLSNGSASVKEPDPNSEARGALHAAGCDVIDRMTSDPNDRGNLGHNKFIVVVKAGTPVRVWTGSANLTPTGLFTQVNNAILIESNDLATQYLAQWQRLHDAGSEVPSTLKKTNAAPAAGIAAPAQAQPWFTPTVKQNDLKRLQELVEGAQKGILFLSFMPGPSGPVFDILEERAAGRYVRGVVNQWVGGSSSKLLGILVGGSKTDPMNLDAFEPNGIKEQFAFWAKEFIQGGKISVLIHSKVMCIDPFGEHPVVVTGSHNFSTAASESNDENFLIIEGDKPLAEAYAAHIISVYNHYRWRQYVGDMHAKGETPWSFLEDKPSWQQSRLKSPRQLEEWNFWM